MTSTDHSITIEGKSPWKVLDLGETFWYLAETSDTEEEVCTRHRKEVPEATLEAKAERLARHELFLEVECIGAPLESKAHPLYEAFRYHAKMLERNPYVKCLVACTDCFFL